MLPIPPSSSSPQIAPPPVLAERWPTLAKAFTRYHENLADHFLQLAYDAIDEGILRLDHRRALVRAAERLHIRPFDAQLLIACALRKWTLDHHHNPRPNPNAPRLSFEFQSLRRMTLRITLVLTTALALDAIIIYKFFT